MRRWLRKAGGAGLLLLACVLGHAQTISTVAGRDVGDGGAATSASLNYPYGVAADSAGNLYIADYYHQRVRKVAAGAGVITTIAGNGRYTTLGDGSAATGAGVRFPIAVAVDSTGNVYVATDNRVRRIAAATGVITTVAGTGTAGFSGDGGAATSARLNDPQGVAIDAAGNLYIADTGNNRVRRVTAGGTISTVAGNGTAAFGGDNGAATSASLDSPRGVAVSAAGYLLIADYDNARIRKLTFATGVITTVAGGGVSFSDGVPATSAYLEFPSSVAVDSSGNFYLRNSSNRIRKVTAASGIISTFAGTDTGGYTGDGGLATSARIYTQAGLAVDAGNNVYIADTYNNVIRRVSTSGIIATVVGRAVQNGVPATSTALYMPRGIAATAAGDLYFADANSARVRKVSAGGTITTLAGGGLCCATGDGGPATSAFLVTPMHVAVDGAGSVFVSDRDDYRIRKVTTAGTISTVAGSGGYGDFGDGGLAVNAEFAQPMGIAVDASGNLYIADSGNHRIRRVSPSGIISTVAGSGLSGYAGDGGAATAARLNFPTGVAVDGANNLYIADWYNNRVRKVALGTGVISTVAGTGSCCFGGDFGPATEAAIDPYGVAVDASGNLLITDYTSRVRRVRAATGVIATIAGGASQGFAGDGGPGTAALLLGPSGVAYDGAGNAYLSDSFNERIRKVTPDGSAPDTSITGFPGTTFAYSPATFTFASSDGSGGASGFQCSIDGGTYRACDASATFSHLGPGTHTLSVRAVDSWGNADASPTSTTWTVNRVGLSAGKYYACATDANGAVSCWGDNGSGKLGSGESIYSLVPVTVVGEATSVTAVSASQNTTCALATSGDVLCWGGNYYGELGNGTDTSSATPTKVLSIPAPATALSVGVWHSCAVTNAGAAYCWGLNLDGQLGNASIDHHSTAAVPVQGLGSGVVAIAAGTYHSCAIVTGGAVRCWGSNSYGQLGNGTTTSSTTPVTVTGLSGAVSISVAQGHSCAATNAGAVYCWGDNFDAQLGNGTTVDSTVPVRVALTPAANKVSVGDFYSCAVTTAGALHCWGTNYFNAMGTGTGLNVRSLTPVAVSALASGVTAISTNRTHGCAVKSPGTVYCWGDNPYGGLGDGTTTNRPTPVLTQGLPAGMTAVGAGNHHSCAITGTRRAMCWGYNGDGQLGGGGPVGRSAPVAVKGFETGGALEVDTGVSHTCARTAAGGVMCWGSNSVGQLGNNSFVYTSTPVAAQGLASGVAAVTVGASHTCAATTAGAVWCWGDNSRAQLGVQNTRWSLVPIQGPAFPAPVTALSAGWNHTCALTSAGKVYCWGTDTTGALGNGSTTTTYTPLQVQGLPANVTGISGSLYHQCAVTLDGEVWCWGNNLNGQLGNATYTSSSTPVKVVGLPAKVARVSAGRYHTCGLLVTGGAMCWGGNAGGQLGDGFAGDAAFPVHVTGLTSGAAAVAAGSESCAITSDGAVRCWGDSNFGQMGDGAYVVRLKPVTVLARNGAGRLDTNDWFLDLDLSKAKAIATELTPKVLTVGQMTLSGTGVKFDTTVTYKGSDLNKTVGHFVFALVPPSFFSLVKRAPGSETEKEIRAKSGENLVFAQLTPAGWTNAAGQLIASTQGVANAAGGASNILDGIRTDLIPGARFCVGYGTSATDMLTSESFREVLVVPGAAVTVDNRPCVLSGVYVDGPPTSKSGTPVTFKVTVVGNNPSGSAQLKDNAANLGPTLALGAANAAVAAASHTTGSLTVGEHSIGAAYDGDANNAASSAQYPLRHTVAPAIAGTTVALAGDASSTRGTAVTFTATVTGANPTGTVQFKDGAANLGSPAPLLNGVAMVSVSTLALGNHTLTAAYSGDGANAASNSNAIAHTVYDTIATSVALTSNAATVTVGTAVTLTATVTGNNPTGSVTFRDGAATLGTVALANGTASLTVPSLAAGQHAITAEYSGDAANQVVTSAAYFQLVSEPATPAAGTRLSNIATRGPVFTGDNVMIGGFVIGGTTPKKVLITARGPSMAAQGVPGLLANPQLFLYSGQTVIAANDDWGTNANAAEIAATGFGPTNAVESALLVTLGPGAYTAIVTGSGGATGIGIVEVFEVDKPEVPLVNIATRAPVLSGDHVMIGGFIISGTTPKSVLITARGPSLAAQGVPGVLANPQLFLYSGQTVIAANDDWGTNTNAAAIQASGVGPTNPLEAALLVTLNPGAYTAIVTGAAGSTGIGIVEVFAQ